MQFPFQIESVCVIGLPSAHLIFANFQGLIGRWKVAFYDALIKFFASLQIFLFMPVKQMSWPILVRCQIKQELIRSKKSNVFKKGHFVKSIYTFNRIGAHSFLSRSSKEVYISWPYETHSLALVSFALCSGRQRAPVETITRLVMILTRSCWFGAWVSIFTPQGKFLFKQQPNFCCYLRKNLEFGCFLVKKTVVI